MREGLAFKVCPGPCPQWLRFESLVFRVHPRDRCYHLFPEEEVQVYPPFVFVEPVWAYREKVVTYLFFLIGYFYFREVAES